MRWYSCESLLAENAQLNDVTLHDIFTTTHYYYYNYNYYDASNQNLNQQQRFSENMKMKRRDNVCKEHWRLNMELLRLLCLQRMVDWVLNAPYF